MREDPIETLLVMAAPNEVTAACRAFDAGEAEDSPMGEPLRLADGLWVIRTGVGKANAAARMGGFLANHLPKRVISLGIAGALPGAGLEIGEAVIASRSVQADEGVETPGGFLDLASMGFPLYEGDDGTGLPPDEGVRSVIATKIEASRVIATVSTCSGTDELAERIRRRTGAGAENMEGAAVMLACLQAGVPAAEVRIISNTTGDRASQVWDMKLALERLGKTARVLSELAFD